MNCPWELIIVVGDFLNLFTRLLPTIIKGNPWPELPLKTIRCYLRQLMKTWGQNTTLSPWFNWGANFSFPIPINNTIDNFALNRVCGKKFLVGAGCGVWGVGFYPFSCGQLPNFQGKSTWILPPTTPMASTFWLTKSLKVLPNKVFRFIQQALNKPQKLLRKNRHCFIFCLPASIWAGEIDDVKARNYSLP